MISSTPFSSASPLASFPGGHTNPYDYPESCADAAAANAYAHTASMNDLPWSYPHTFPDFEQELSNNYLTFGHVYDPSMIDPGTYYASQDLSALFDGAAHLQRPARLESSARTGF
ncbi:hypothetical protein NUW54_g11525 [Trametes sanguinea]|uniref:Uncharacterized protein n=1 Tax=Trametes sanguinea TaxID=158606 RepID=A0ACC1NCC2_9APHY|nr:hypothetical protein NUW54_g11525 [Trametes sanguinea]